MKNENAVNPSTEEVQIPKGYLIVTHRLRGHNVKSHLYSGGFNAVGVPMCKQAPNSILRNWLSKKGVCKNCLNNANSGMTGQELLTTLKAFGKRLTKNGRALIKEFQNNRDYRLYVVNTYGDPLYGTIAVTLKDKTV